MTNISLVKDLSFSYDWVVPGALIDSESMSTDISENNTLMYITKNNEIVDILSLGAGLAISFSPEENIVKIIVAISDTGQYDIGVYDYDIKVYNFNDDLLLEDSGTLTVQENTTGEVIKTVFPWDLLNPNEPRSSRQTRLERLKICGECPNLKANFCTECGCFMPLKTTLQNATCPIHKW
jgi:hypothetical protein